MKWAKALTLGFFAIHSFGYGIAWAAGKIKAQKKAQPQKTHTIVIEAMKFHPESLELEIGDSVMWINKDFFPHNAVAGNQAFQSVEIKPGDSWKWEAKQQGELPYSCTLHPTMKGTLRVK